MTVRTNAGASCGHHRRRLAHRRRLRRQLDPVQAGERVVDGGVVARHDLAAAPAVGLLDRALDPGDRLVAGSTPEMAKKQRLQDGVDAAREPGLARDAAGVHHVQRDPPGEDPLLHGARQLVPHPVGRHAGS